jgi:TetR/AcrR family tetracycline transcriptional repressor
MGLDRETIVRTGLELLNEVGLDGFTTRRLADRLGVKQPAIYWHFRGKREILDEMAAHMVSEGRGSEPDVDGGDDWMESLKHQARTFRNTLLRYRDGARVHAGTRPNTELFASLDSRAGRMCVAGFEPIEAVRAMMIISHYVVGSVIEEQAADDAQRDDGGMEFEPDPQVYPILGSGAARLNSEDPSVSFEFGLDALARGLAARIATRPAPNQTLDNDAATRRST